MPLFGKRAPEQDPFAPLGTNLTTWIEWRGYSLAEQTGRKIPAYRKSKDRHLQAEAVMDARLSAIRAGAPDSVAIAELCIADGILERLPYEFLYRHYHQASSYSDLLRVATYWYAYADAICQMFDALQRNGFAGRQDVETALRNRDALAPMVERAEQLTRERDDNGRLRAAGRGRRAAAPQAEETDREGAGIADRVSMDKEIARFLEPLGTTIDEYLDYWRRQQESIGIGNFRKDARLEKAEETAVARYNLAEACRLKGRDDLALLLHAANVRDQVPFPASYNKLITACHKAKDYRGEVDAIEAFLAWSEAQDRFYGPPKTDLEASQRIAARAKLEARLEKARAKLAAG